MISAGHLLLVGMMGTGKSTVGARVAKRLGRPFRDSDVAVEERTGHSIPEIFRTDGEPVFRSIEEAVIAALLDDPTPSVIALGGGAVLSERTRERLADRFVVWLDADLDVLRRRIGAGSGRPLLAGRSDDASGDGPDEGSRDDLDATIARLMDERRHLYEQVATVTVVTDDSSPDVVVDAIVEAVRRHDRVKA